MPRSTDNSSSEIDPDVIVKLMHDIQNNKSLELDWKRKCTHLIDPTQKTEYLAYIVQASMDSRVLSHRWKSAVNPIHKKEIEKIRVTIYLSL